MLSKKTNSIILTVLLLLFTPTSQASCPAKQGKKGSDCVACSDKNCLDCDANYAVCTKCPVGFGLKSNVCVTCSTYCIACEDINKCKECSNGAVLKGDVCEECGTGCKKCTGVNQCTECNDSFYLTNGKCVKDCPEAFTEQGKTCVRCPLDCLKCTNPNICQGCTTGYHLNAEGNSVNCKKCMIGCAECLGENYCERCDTSFKRTNEGFCDGYNGDKYWWLWMILGLVLVGLLICCLCALLFRKPQLEYREMEEIMPYQKQPMFESAIDNNPYTEQSLREDFYENNQPIYREEDPINVNGPLEIKQYEGAPPTRVDVGPPVKVRFTPPRQRVVVGSGVQGLQFYDQFGNRSQF